MLPKLHLQAYQEFLTVLLTLRDRATANQLDEEELQKSFERVQQVFQEKLIGLNGEEIDPAILPRWQSVQTEIYRALRLLSTDILFLRSSRRAATSEQRLSAVRDRVEKMIGYCQAIIQGNS